MILIAGPCMLESESVVGETAAAVRALKERLEGRAGEGDPVRVYFKGSYDKANRTSLDSPRGPGLEVGLELLRMVQREYGLPVLTDVHSAAEAAAAGKICEALQIPAFLCRQTDLLVAAARTGRIVNVKKGQFMAPGEMRFVVNKLEGSRASEIWLTERGTTFGYQSLVVDMRAIPIMQGLGHPVIFDATHSVQNPGGGTGVTVGQREFVPTLSRAAAAAGADGLFVEVHPNPDSALSDGPNQIPLSGLDSVVDGFHRVREAVGKSASSST